MTPESLMTTLVRTPESLLQTTDDRFAATLTQLAGFTIFGGAVLGAIVGSQHSLLQAGYSAVKLPVILFLCPCLAVPAIAELTRTLGGVLPIRRAALAGMATMARTTLYALALCPLWWLFCRVGGAYEITTLATAAMMGVSGLAGLSVLGRAPISGPRQGFGARALTFLGATLLFFAVGGQSGWLLRPILRPPTLDAAFLAPAEDDVFTGILRHLARALPD